MKNIFFFLFLVASLASARAGVNFVNLATDTNGVLQAPAKFFAANSNAINAVVATPTNQVTAAAVDAVKPGLVVTNGIDLQNATNEFPHELPWNSAAMPVPNDAFTTYFGNEPAVGATNYTSWYEGAFIYEILKYKTNGMIAAGHNIFEWDDGWQLNVPGSDGLVTWNPTNLPNGFTNIVICAHTNGALVKLWIDAYRWRANLQTNISKVISFGVDGIVEDEVAGAAIVPNGSTNFNFAPYYAFERMKALASYNAVQNAYYPLNPSVDLPGSWTNPVANMAMRGAPFSILLYSSVPWEFEFQTANEYGVPSYGAQAAIQHTDVTQLPFIVSIVDTVTYYVQHSSKGHYSNTGSYFWNNTGLADNTNWFSLASVLNFTFFTSNFNAGNTVIQTNMEVMNIWRDPLVARPFFPTNFANGTKYVQVIAKQLTPANTYAVCFFNRDSNTTATVTLNLTNVNEAFPAVVVRDPFGYSNISTNVGTMTVTIAPGNSRVFVLSPLIPQPAADYYYGVPPSTFLTYNSTGTNVQTVIGLTNVLPGRYEFDCGWYIASTNTAGAQQSFIPIGSTDSGWLNAWRYIGNSTFPTALEQHSSFLNFGAQRIGDGFGSGSQLAVNYSASGILTVTGVTNAYYLQILPYNGTTNQFIIYPQSYVHFHPLP